MSPVSLKSEQLRSDSPNSRVSSPRRVDGHQHQPVFSMSTASMEISRDSLKEVSEPPILTSVPPPVVAVKPKPAVITPSPSRPQQRPAMSSSASASEPSLPPQGPVVEAMSPSVAESIRAVFAAFIWHAGVYHINSFDSVMHMTMTLS